MPRYTDCRRRRVRTMGCDCAYCQDNSILKDGEISRHPMAFLDGVQQAVGAHFDAAQEVADGWPKRVFDAAGVPIREDALSAHERAMRGEQRTPEEIDRDRRHQAEAEQQARTANRQAASADGWDKALAKLHQGGGGVKEAGFTRI